MVVTNKCLQTCTQKLSINNKTTRKTENNYLHPLYHPC